MVFFSTKRRVVVNGRLVDSATIDLQVKWARFFTLLWWFCILWLTNPYNNPEMHTDAVTFAGHHWTNYAIFAVRARRRGDGLTLYALGQDVTCYYSFEPCRQLKEFLGHERPLLWDPKDRAYTTHHILMLIYILLVCVRWCTNIDSMVHQGSYGACLFSLFFPTWRSWIEAKWFLFPAWERMNVLMITQQSQSLFRLFENVDTNYALSVIVFYLLAALCLYTTRVYWNAHVSNLSLSPSSHLVAMALGFVRGSMGDNARRLNNGRMTFPPFLYKLSPLAATWTVFALQVAVAGVPALIPWWLSHTVGAVMGEYQYQNQQLVYFVDSLWTGLRDSFQSLFQF